MCNTNSVISDCSKINIYQSTAQFSRLGGICAPTEEAARNKLFKNLNISEKYEFLNTYDVIRISMLIALGVGILWMVLVQLIPRLMAGLSIILASLLLIAFGILLLVDNPKGWQGKQVWRIIIGILLILFALFCVVLLCIYKRRIKITGVLLHYAASFIRQKAINVIFIPIFLLLTVGLIVLCMFQYLAYSSNADPVKQDDDIYLKNWAHPLLTILNIIEFIWGMQFLKDSCKYHLIQSISWFQGMLLNGISKMAKKLTVVFLYQDISVETLVQSLEALL